MDKRKNFSTSRATYQSTQSTTSVLSSNSSSVTWTNASVEPESSSEIFQQLQELNKDVDTTAEFVCGVNDILCATIPANVFLVMIGCFAVAEISLGMNYLADCPVEPKVPIFLFVGGCFALLKIMHMLWTNFKLRRRSDYISGNDHEKSHRTVQIVDGVLNIFLVVWQILGIYWTLHVWCPNWDPPLHEPDSWCDHGLYIFTVVQIILAVAIVVSRVCCQVWLIICYKYTNLFEG